MSVELINVTKIFKNQQVAVNNLNLTIPRGETLCLLGPSGCGKTTTLRMIAGFERPTGGAILINGTEVAGGGWVPPEKRKIGMVFQDYALFPHLNVYQNISFGLKAKDNDTKSKVTELIKLVGLKGLEDRFPHQLSGGQQQRVSLARAMAREPVVLLLDEPFSNLDAVLRLEMREEIKRIIKEAGLTAVFVTHDIQDALAVADRIVVMKNGEIQQAGTPREIYTRPKNKFVASFLGRFSLVEGQMAGSDRLVTEFCELIHSSGENTSVGQTVYLGIPPEAIKINPEGNFSGQIKGVRYLGDKWEANIIINNGRKEPTEISVRTYFSLNDPHENGGQIRFDFDRESLVVLDS